MPLLKFHFSKSVTPCDRFRATMPTGYVVTADNRDEWFGFIEKHHKDNDIPLPENWRAYYEDQLCRVLPPGMCEYEDGTGPSVHISTRFSILDLQRGTEMLARIATHPDPLVTQEVAEERGRVCAACPVNVRVGGCFACFSIPQLIVEIKGAHETKADKVLANCGICHCVNRAQVWVKDELLAKGITPDMHKKFQSLHHCWKGSIPPEA
jgi:hypothetical protein